MGSNTMDPTEKNWYGVYTHPNAEKKLLQQVKNRQLDAYLPLQQVMRQWSDRKKWLWVPLFKSYLFVYVDLNGLHQIKTLPGFAQYIRFGGYPVVIAQQHIDVMKVVVERYQNVTTVPSKLVKGDRVSIIKGALAGYEGVLISDQQGKKVALQIGQLNQSMLVKIANSDIVKI